MARRWRAARRLALAGRWDNDHTRFLAYLVAALQTVAPEIGKGALAALQSPQPPPLESLLTPLLNELAALQAPSILVLDDYHVIDSKPVDHTLAFLLEHLPPQLHLVITTREDLALPLPRLRAGPADQAARRRLAFYGSGYVSIVTTSCALERSRHRAHANRQV